MGILKMEDASEQAIKLRLVQNSAKTNVVKGKLAGFWPPFGDEMAERRL